MILKDKFDILGADHTTIYTVRGRYTRIEGLPKRCVFVVHRRVKVHTIDRPECTWVVAEFTSTRIIGMGVSPEAAVEDAVARFSKSDYNGDTIAFKKLCKAARDAWMNKRIDDIPHLEPYEQLSFVRNASLVSKLPVWKLGDD